MFDVIFVGAVTFIWTVFIVWVIYELYQERNDD